MKYIFFAISGIVAFCIVKVVMSTFKGKRYWDYCERRFDELLAQGHSSKCPDVTRLVNFIYNALEMGQIWENTNKKKLTNEEAEALIEFTTISEGGKVNTNYSAAKEKLQQK
jgi:hypothetical protein